MSNDKRKIFATLFLREMLRIGTPDPAAADRKSESLWRGALKGYFYSFFRQIWIKLAPFCTALPVMWLDQSVFEAVNQFADGNSKVLNLGSGRGLFDRNLKVRTINLDYELSAYVHVVGDAHKLPLKDRSIDCVFSNAALEHVRSPWIVVEEIKRVLKPQGYVCVQVPFLNIRHGAHDYYRFTLEGLRELLRDFRELKSGVSAGPWSFLTAFLIHYLASFFPFRSHYVRKGLQVLITLPIFPLKYLDLFFANTQNRREDVADGVYFIGVLD
jgi:SAM-dependent methyltransferase